MKKKEEFLAKMDLKEKVGQLFLIGFKGQGINIDVEEMITSFNPGGLIYFSRNIKNLQQTTNLSNELQELAYMKGTGLPLFIAADQEGGTVTRLKDITHFPGNMVLGATRDEDLAFEAGRLVARQLKGAGINMNLAPVLDVNINPSNPVIGVRSYGEDPKLVAKMGSAWIRGLQGEGVIACGKHFPGHGDTGTDSHFELPVVNHDLKRLEEVEFYPFKSAIATGVDSIMTAHVNFPAVTLKTGLPATLSYRVLTELLRKKLKFEGLIITDCMEMNAITDTYGTVEGTIKAIEAGADMVIISHDKELQKSAIEAVISAVREGRISEDRINSSVLRILGLKEKRFGLKKIPAARPHLEDIERGDMLALQIARRGVTLVKDEHMILPLKENGTLTLVDFLEERTTPVSEGTYSSNTLTYLLQKSGFRVKHITLTGQVEELNILNGIEKSSPVLVCTCNAGKNPFQVRVIKKLAGRIKDLMLLATCNPYDLQLFLELPFLMITYDYSPFNLQAAVEILTGKRKPGG